MVTRLWVFLSGQRIGTLDDQGGRLLFTYEAGGRTPVSVNLPVRDEPYGDAACGAYFGNLLPEGGWRRAICRQLRIDERNDFQLLAAIGSECAGAVSLHPDPDWAPRHGAHRETSETELRAWVHNPATRPGLQISPGLRLSLAGAQDKLLFHLDGGTPYLCEGGAPSTVILKPDIRDAFDAIESSALNELLSAHLARHSGIEVVNTFWYAGAYAAHRYDRITVDGALTRLHQEDFAQIAGVPSTAKYEEHGGPGWKECFGILDTKVAAPAAQRIELLHRLLFNLCLGNNDAHAKNFALLHRPHAGSPRLAPAYDLLCTQVHGSLSPALAMAIGGQRDARRLNAADWTRFGHDTGFGFPALRRFATGMAERVGAAVGGLLPEVEAACPALRADVYPLTRRVKFFRRYAAVVTANCATLIRSFAAG